MERDKYLNDSKNKSKSKSKSKPSIVILTFNNSLLVITLVKSLLEFGIFQNIVVVDNHSTDGTYQILEYSLRNIEHVILLQTRENGGYAKGNNYGANWVIKNTNSDIIFFANPDVILNVECIEKITNIFHTSNDYGILAPIMLKPDNSVDEGNYWNEPVYKSELFNCFYLYRHLVTSKQVFNVNFNIPIFDCFAVTGSFYGLNRTSFIKIHGFDENTFLFCEENILGKKLKNIGKKTGLVTYITYIHNHSQIIDSNFKALNKYKIFLASHFYMVKEYITHNPLKLCILKLSQKYSIFEMLIILNIKSFINKFINWNNFKLVRCL